MYSIRSFRYLQIHNIPMKANLVIKPRENTGRTPVQRTFGDIYLDLESPSVK